MVLQFIKLKKRLKFLCTLMVCCVLVCSFSFNAIAANVIIPSNVHISIDYSSSNSEPNSNPNTQSKVIYSPAVMAKANINPTSPIEQNLSPSILPTPTQVPAPAFVFDTTPNATTITPSAVVLQNTSDNYEDISSNIINGIASSPTVVLQNKEEKTTSSGVTINTNGSVKDDSGKTYNLDGTIDLPGGNYIDANGITHYNNGSIMLADGTLYRSDGSITYPNGTVQTETGRVIKKTKKVLEKELKEREKGAWEYDPITNNWHISESDSSLPLYK